MADCNKIQDLAERTACLDLDTRIAKLEKSVETLSGGFWGRAVELTPAWVATALGAISVVVAVLGALILWRVFRDKSLKVKEAVFKVGSNTITMEAAAEKINQLLTDVQDYVIADAAMRDMRKTVQIFNALPDEEKQKALVQSGGSPLGMQILNDLAGQKNSAFNDKPEQGAPVPELKILWVTDNTDTLLFESKVLSKMGNDITTVKSNTEAMAKIRSGYTYNLIISDVFREDEDKQAGITLYRNLSQGIRVPDWLGGEVVRIGDTLRFAIYSGPKRVKEFEDVVEGDANAIITSDFSYLRSRVRWLQENLSFTLPPQPQTVKKGENHPKENPVSNPPEEGGNPLEENPQPTPEGGDGGDGQK